MGCRCTERAAALTRARTAVVSGNVKNAAHEIAHVGRTLVEDARSGALRRAAVTQLARMRGPARR